MKKTLFFLTLSALFFGYETALLGQSEPENLTLWYDQPATDWMTEALPIGNGYMGSMFFGGIDEEQIQFTEESLWTGGPGSHPEYNFGLREDARKYLPEIRELLNQKKFEEAHELAGRELTGIIHTNPDTEANFGDYGAQQTMGDLFVVIEQSSNISGYRRELDLNHSRGSVEYTAGDVHHSRTYFGSYPARTMVYHFENNASGGTVYELRFSRPHLTLDEDFSDGRYFFRGEVENNGMEFGVVLEINTDGTDIQYSNGKVVVSDANNMTILHTAATNYRNEFPEYTGEDYKKTLQSISANWKNRTWREMLHEHQNDYRNLFDRVLFSLAGPDRSNIPTNLRLDEYYNGADDSGLEVLYFQYARYLMISGSRPGTLPLNLQGKWNNSTTPPWSNDYHMNINQQMLYWPANGTNLQESNMPLFDYLESLVEPGRLAAREFFGTRGWIVNTMNNAFGYTSPGWGLPWGFFPGGAAWLSRHMWEHYQFTLDRDFLRETAYPVMKEAALYWMDYLVEDEIGNLVSNPSYSPEHGGISEGASMDHQIAWDILDKTAKAAEVLKTDQKFREKALQARDRILPPQIGRWGQLQEWKEDVDDPENKHRHVSHLYALHPGNQISVTDTPELAEAARTSLEARGDGGTGWSLAWKINFWSRLKDGERAYLLLQRLLQPMHQQEVEMEGGGGSYANLLCAHPPYQLDGNMGAAAGITEMLLQSHTGVVELLPALPDAWPEGTVKGLRARGGLTLDLEWLDGNLVKTGLQSQEAGSYQITYRGNTIEINLNENETKTLTASSFGY